MVDCSLFIFCVCATWVHVAQGCSCQFNENCTDTGRQKKRKRTSESPCWTPATERAKVPDPSTTEAAWPHSTSVSKKPVLESFLLPDLQRLIYSLYWMHWTGPVTLLHFLGCLLVVSPLYDLVYDVTFILINENNAFEKIKKYTHFKQNI